jgi:hypothetical protein
MANTQALFTQLADDPAIQYQPFANITYPLFCFISVWMLLLFAIDFLFHN